jgi:nitrate reductase gamma subunit
VVEFHMRDAAIGAGAATGLILLTAGMVLGLRRRHRHEVFSVVIQRSL